MKNLEKMKKDFANLVEKMDINEFWEFLSVLHQDVEAKNLNLDLSAFFKCEACREMYGNCRNKGEGECLKRFKKFALGETNSR